MLMISGIVMMEKRVDNATNAPATFVFLLNIAANIVVFAAPGADAEIITTVEIRELMFKNLRSKSAITGQIIRRKKTARQKEKSFKISGDVIFER